MTDVNSQWDALAGETVVLDVSSPYVYIGVAAGADHRYLTLTDADAHDLRDTKTTREMYVLDAKRHGVSVNRRRVHVRIDEVVSFSMLADIIE